MRITIAQRLRPFCHLPGTACPIPFTRWQVQAFAEMIALKDLVTAEEKVYPLGWKGPVWDFTVELDLEKGCVRLFGHTADGYRSLTISAAEGGLKLGDELISVDGIFAKKAVERLSLGSHRQLDWELVKRRRDLTESLPVWFRLGQMVPEVAAPKVGTASLLQDVPKLEVVSQLTKLFYAGFSSLLSPRLIDDDRQGIVPQMDSCSSCPLILLWQGASLIRSLFFTEEENDFSFLPCLPPEFHAGRFIDIRTTQGDCLEMEWAKKSLHKVVIRPGSSRSVRIKAQKPLTSFRLRYNLRERGKRFSLTQPLHLEEGKPVMLDRFE